MSKLKFEGYRSGIAVHAVDPRTLVSNERWSPRNDYGDMKALTANIKKHGVHTPLLVFKNPDGKLQVIDGHRRLRAVMISLKGKESLADDKESALYSVPIRISNLGKVSDDEKTVQDLISFLSYTGLPLKPYEEAGAFDRLIKLGLTDKQVSENLGISLQYVRDRIALVSGTVPVVFESLKKNEVSFAAVQRIIKASEGSQEKQLELFEKEKEKKGSSKEDLEESKEKGQIRRVVLKRSKIKENAGERLTIRKARVLLSEVSESWEDFVHSRLPANKANTTWEKLKKTLNEVRNLRKTGVLKI